MMYSKISWKSLEFFLLNGHRFNFNLRKTIQYFAEAQLNCPIAYTYTKKELKSLLRDYKILEMKKEHIFPFIIEEYINHNYKKRLIFKFLPNRLFRILERILGWHFLIKFKIK